jgi:hypothetical protein
MGWRYGSQQNTCFACVKTLVQIPVPPKKHQTIYKYIKQNRHFCQNFVDKVMCKRIKLGPDTGAHACNPRYSEEETGKITVPAWAKNH